MPTDNKSRVKKIVGIDYNTTPEELGIDYNTGFLVSTIPSVSRTIPAYGYYDNEGYFHTPYGIVTENPLPNNQELEVVTRRLPKQNDKFYDRFVGSYYRNLDLNLRDLNIAKQYLQSPNPIDIIKGLYYANRANRPESAKEASLLTVNLPIDIGKKGAAKAIFERAIKEGKDIKKIFLYMPKAAQEEILADNTLRKALEYKGLTKATLKGERVFYGEGPSFSGTPKLKRYLPFDIEDALIVSDSEDVATRIMQQNRRNRARGVTELELPVSSLPEIPTSNGLQKPVLKSNTERVADILEDKSTEGTKTIANETLKLASLLNPYLELKNKASIKWKSYDDDKALVEKYKEMALKGEVDQNPEFDALVEELRFRKLIDNDRRFIQSSVKAPKELVSFNKDLLDTKGPKEVSDWIKEVINNPNSTKLLIEWAQNYGKSRGLYKNGVLLETPVSKSWKHPFRSADKPLKGWDQLSNTKTSGDGFWRTSLKILWETGKHNFGPSYKWRNAGRAISYGAGLWHLGSDDSEEILNRVSNVVKTPAKGATNVVAGTVGGAIKGVGQGLGIIPDTTKTDKPTTPSLTEVGDSLQSASPNTKLLNVEGQPLGGGSFEDYYYNKK